MYNLGLRCVLMQKRYGVEKKKHISSTFTRGTVLSFMSVGKTDLRRIWLWVCQSLWGCWTGCTLPLHPCQRQVPLPPSLQLCRPSAPVFVGVCLLLLWRECSHSVRKGREGREEREVRERKEGGEGKGKAKGSKGGREGKLPLWVSLCDTRSNMACFFFPETASSFFIPLAEAGVGVGAVVGGVDEDADADMDVDAAVDVGVGVGRDAGIGIGVGVGFDAETGVVGVGGGTLSDCPSPTGEGVADAVANRGEQGGEGGEMFEGGGVGAI